MDNTAELTAKIVAQGEKVRLLKSSGKDVSGDLATLLALKAEYKSATGSDYGPPKADTKAEVLSQSGPSSASAANAGPSKTEQKRLAKLEKKAGAKEQPTAPSTKVPSASSASMPAAAESFLQLYVPGPGIALQKCLLTSHLFGVVVEPASAEPRGGLPADAKLAISKTSVIFGSNSVCRYLAYLGRGRDAIDERMDDFMEWEESVLMPAVVSGDTSDAFHTFEERLMSSEGPFLGGEEPSLLDAIAGPVVAAAASAPPPAVRAYAERVTASKFYAAAQSAAEAFDRGDGNGTGLLASLSKIFSAAIVEAFPEAKELGQAQAAVMKCPNYNHGDFQCNNAMALQKALKAAGVPNAPLKPQDVANAIVAALRPNAIVRSASVAGAGFINIRLRPGFITRKIGILAKEGTAPPPVAKRFKVLVDFSSPNIAKEMHVGHLRSTIIGDTICRVLEYCGHEVLRVNHIGDWGTQFGMLINYMKEANESTESSGENAAPNISDLTAFYKAAKKRFDESEDFKELSRQAVVRLQAGDPECRKVWQRLCDISKSEFDKVYGRLNVKLEEKGESFYNPLIPDAIAVLEAKGMVEKDPDNGAALVNLEGWTYPLIVRKGDGGFGYDSTDVAAIRYRLQTLGCDWLIYVTDDGQSSHFKMVFDTAKAAGWTEYETRIDHVGFGVVKGEDNKKFKTRSGETVRLVDLLDEAVERMEHALKERVAEGKSPLKSEEEIHAAATAIGYGAVKYFDQRQHPGTAYIFSYDRMLDTRGNTAVYILYTHARLASILRKAQDEYDVDLEALYASGAPVSIEHPSERALAFELLQFPDKVTTAVATLLPNGLCDYLYDLAGKFTDFITECHVLGSAERDGRLLLCRATGVVMRQCLDVLGIQALDKI